VEENSILVSLYDIMYNLMLNYVLKNFKVTVYLDLILLQKFRSFCICTQACINIIIIIHHYCWSYKLHHSCI